MMGAALHVHHVRRSRMLCVACAARASAASGTATAAGLHLSSGAPRMRDERVVCLCVRVRVKGLSTALGSLGPGPDRGRTRLSFFGSRSLTKCETSFPYCPCPSKTPENQRTLDGAPAGSSALLFDGVMGGCTHARAAWRMQYGCMRAACPPRSTRRSVGATLSGISRHTRASRSHLCTRVPTYTHECNPSWSVATL